MLENFVKFLLGGAAKPMVAQREKLFFETGPDHVYAIGDVHGCDDLLARLESRIVADSAGREGAKWLILLGDYVDRGPASAAVIDRLTRPAPAGLTRFCLAGNHEEVMLEFLRDPAPNHRWLDFGGVETLESYGIHKIPGNRQDLKNLIDSHVPREHVAFLESLPSLISLPRQCFVHAGLKKGVPLAAQEDETILWMRPKKSDGGLTPNDFVTVHGHTPVSAVRIGPDRVNLDTGAYATGLLSAVRLSRDGAVAIIPSR